MPAIKKETVEVIAGRFRRLDGGKAHQLTLGMKEEQPAVLGYLLNVGPEAFSQQEREWIIFLGVSIWQIFLHEYPHLPQITQAALDKAAKNTAGLIGYLKDENKDDMRTTMSSVLQDYHQPAVLDYVVQALNVGFGEKTIREINLTVLFFFLKIIIDCFDEATDVKQ